MGMQYQTMMSSTSLCVFTYVYKISDGTGNSAKMSVMSFTLFFVLLLASCSLHASSLSFAS